MVTHMSPWLYRYSEQHQCKTPKLDHDAYSGDVWQCEECQRYYVVRSDQRDGPYFELVKEEDIRTSLERINRRSSF